MVRNVNIISGLTLSGKSRLLSQLTQHPEFRDAAVVSMDEVRMRYWGSRGGGGKNDLTPTEKIYRNKLVRDEIRNLLVTSDVPSVLVEVPMLTREHHQKPMVAMIGEAREYVLVIELEKAGISEKESSEPSDVSLNVVLVYCDVSTAKRRLEWRQRETAGISDVQDIGFFLRIALQFELPSEDIYLPLPIDTSNEGSLAEISRLVEIVKFLKGEKPPREILRERMKIAEATLKATQEIARGYLGQA